MKVRGEMNIAYVPDKQWRFDTSTGEYPDWHDDLAPSSQRNQYDCEVEVKKLGFPNVLDIRLLHSLNAAWSPQVLATVPMQAIINGFWSCVRKAVMLNTVVEVLTVAIFTAWAFAPRE